MMLRIAFIVLLSTLLGTAIANDGLRGPANTHLEETLDKILVKLEEHEQVIAEQQQVLSELQEIMSALSENNRRLLDNDCVPHLDPILDKCIYDVRPLKITQDTEFDGPVTFQNTTVFNEDVHIGGYCKLRVGGLAYFDNDVIFEGSAEFQDEATFLDDVTIGVSTDDHHHSRSTHAKTTEFIVEKNVEATFVDDVIFEKEIETDDLVVRKTAEIEKLQVKGGDLIVSGDVKATDIIASGNLQGNTLNGDSIPNPPFP